VVGGLGGEKGARRRIGRSKKSKGSWRLLGGVALYVEGAPGKWTEVGWDEWTLSPTTKPKSKSKTVIRMGDIYICILLFFFFFSSLYVHSFVREARMVVGFDN
jgi:hypothetical protein